MIDRRRFVQSMIALGAATSVRPPATLFGAQGATELRDLADAALASAKKLGATYADIRINRYRNQFIFTRDRRVQNIVNTEDYEICQQAQKGMRSRVYRQGRYAANQEMCLHHFHAMLTGAMRPHLAAWDAEHGAANGNGHANGNGTAPRAEVGA